ncbi:MAG: ribokinase [Eubacteriales bacterium]|nr:ribokinase [Eubacteriales bacterium]
MSQARILVCGSLNYDFVMPCPHLPAKGETVMGRELARNTGGKGANQALQAGKLGADTRMIGCVGDDFMGRAQIESLTAGGVSTQYVLRHGQLGTGSALILVDDAGDNCITVSAGANAACDAAYVRGCEEAFAPGAILLVQCEIPVEGMLCALRLAKAHGVMSVLDPAPTIPLPEEVWRLADWVKPNETEAAYHSGVALRPGDMLNWVKEAAAALRAKGASRVLITLGADGSYYCGAEGEFFTPAFSIDPVDTTAAGDSYAGALAVALGEGMDVRGALRFAAGAGALTAQKAGAQPSLPDRAALEHFLQRR